ncbi:Twinkle-like protein, chloroplastic/mitochondrial isoform B [Glycine soja]|uniref:Twinkle-like protein, chloroplastic/mitochondrial isoform B n=1 Tax=Glycine soja TaxID=3848 RepID=A0A445IW97_GLYSO|nr:Twinkle-like protein, chloroplastic/mitochondrial isoform B [Glycine soja]
MLVFQNQWLCLPLTHSLFSKLLPRTKHAATVLSPRLCPVWCHSVARATTLPTSPGGAEQVVDSSFDAPKVKLLKQKMELLGINLEKSCLPGKYHNLFCPKCKGGQLKERSLSFHIISDCEFAMWRCFRAQCGWAGQVSADDKELYSGVCTNANLYRQLAEESLGLEPLGPEVVAYFGERLISEKTLSRNAVRQLSNNKTVIAFTYKQNGLLVGCKYRTMEKRFWQGKGADKILYGIDDISQASEIIIVEGEIDKLSLEEAGFQNCVSVPVGAPEKVSSKDLPPIEKDTAFRYLWNCKEYLDKAVRIILATDNDPPGQALAEELARRLGRERLYILSFIFHVKQCVSTKYILSIIKVQDTYSWYLNYLMY